MMKIYHTSPNEITKIDRFGRFGEFLFFASSPYEMAACETITYSIELSEDEVIEANSFFYREDCDKLADLVAEVMDLAQCDEDDAEEYLSGRKSHEDAEIDWDIQKLTGEAGKVLGYRAVEARDEQGTVWLVAMAGRESELVRE